MSFIEIEKSIRNEEWSMLNLHSHAHYEIYFLQKGNRTFFLSDSLYRLTAPILIIIPPHVLHKTEGSAFERYDVNVSENYLDAFQKNVLDVKALSVIKLSKQQSDNLNNLFNQMHEVDKRHKFYNYIIRSLFSYLIIQIDSLKTETLSANINNDKSTPSQILKIIEYLNCHYAENLTTKDISDLFFISKGALIYNFNRYIKCSPMEYLSNIRITKAKELLQKTNKPISEISELCGFSSANYFGLVFKKRENMSPLAYRKYQRNKS